MQEYCTKEDIKNYLNFDIDNSYDVKISKWIKASSKAIDNIVNRSFGFSDVVEIKTYHGSGTDKMIVDDLVEVILVSLQYGDITDVELDQCTLYSPSGFPRGFKNITVSGKFGFDSEIPEDIIDVCAFMVAQKVIKAEKGGKIRSEKVGNYTIQYAEGEDIDSITETLNSYKKYVL